MSIRQVVNESDTFSGRAFDFVVLFLIVFSIITLTIDTLPDLPSFVSDVLDISEIVITVLFTIEYLVRVAAAPKKIGYILSFYGIVDLIAILPFYIALGVDLRAVRAFRLFRIIRILKLTRYPGYGTLCESTSYAEEVVNSKKIGYILSFYGIALVWTRLGGGGFDFNALIALAVVGAILPTRCVYCVGCRPSAIADRSSAAPAVSFVSHYPYLELPTRQPHRWGNGFATAGLWNALRKHSRMQKKKW